MDLCDYCGAAMNQEQLKAHAARTGIPLEALKQALADECPEEPLEIPDRMDVTFKYSYGELTPFFRALREERQFLGTKCRVCGKVTLPPRPHCTRCRTDCDWVECGPVGTVVAATTVHFGTSASGARAPFVCAYVQLDNADTAILASISSAAAKAGMRVRAKFREVCVGRLDDVEFVPEE